MLHRRLDQDEATFGEITAPHQALTHEQFREGVWLILNDTTELNFGDLREIEGIGRVLRRPRPVRPIRDFYRALASLGGFLGRKCDGDPGWQTIWRGLDTLLQCLRGMESRPNQCGSP